MSKEESKEQKPTFQEVLNKAGKSAMRGGTAGAVAMGANVACLMWMRTTVSHYVNGFALIGKINYNKYCSTFVFVNSYILV